MNGDGFDWLSRFFGRGSSRRNLLSAIATILGGGLVGQRASATPANQLGPASCGASGAVCTMLMGCCSGLTCVTSAINTNYGVCVTGDGGTVSVGTTLISPFSEEVEQEVAAIAAQVTTSTTSSTTSERDQRQAEIEARKATTKSRKDTNRTERRTRADEQQDRKRARKISRRSSSSTTNTTTSADSPELELQVFNPGGVDGSETLKVTNRGSSSVILNKIESLLDPELSSDLSTDDIVLDIGESYLFISGQPTADAELDRIKWTDQIICHEDESGDGLLIKAAFTADEFNTDYTALCTPPPAAATSDPTPTPTPRKKRKKRKKNSKKKKR